MSKISQWAGLVASFFSVLWAVIILFFISAQFGPEWEGPIVVACMLFSGVSGAICLISAVLEHFRKWRERLN
jgi:hypothetical protein